MITNLAIVLAVFRVVNPVPRNGVAGVGVGVGHPGCPLFQVHHLWLVPMSPLVDEGIIGSAIQALGVYLV